MEIGIISSRSCIASCRLFEEDSGHKLPTVVRRMDAIPKEMLAGVGTQCVQGLPIFAYTAAARCRIDAFATGLPCYYQVAGVAWQNRQKEFMENFPHRLEIMKGIN